MATEQTAQQLELAAQILRTGHPWEYRRIAGGRYKYNTPIEVVADGNFLSPLLATPPDNRQLHNPDNLTAEQVGVGYRLTVEGESVPGVGAEWWCRSSSAWLTSTGAYLPQRNTVRVPLKTPWPEPAFQLPPAPPGMRWHREDGWTADDLPQGYRPFYLGEVSVTPDHSNVTDQVGNRSGWGTLSGGEIATRNCCLLRTTRPLTFNHAGKTWTYRRPGDPMPCDGGSLIWAFYDDGTPSLNSYCANDYIWGRVIGWRYAEPQTKTVPLSPEDVPPGSVFRSKDQPTTTFWAVSQVWEDGFYLRGDNMPWDTARERMQINRSIPLTGKWSPDAWESCSKTLPA